MRDTEYKIDESKFFLEKLKESKDIQPQFNYYLNAFISSARSVLWIMNKEYNKVEGWRSWYDKKAVKKDDAIILKGITDMRNRSLKSTPPRIRKTFYVGNEKENINLNDVLERFAGKKISLSIGEPDKEKGTFNYAETDNSFEVQGKLSSKHTVEEFKDRDILEVCDAYMAWLEEVTSECFELFG